MKKLLFVLSILVVTIAVNIAPDHVGAVTGADWRAGRIIDDSIFTDKNSMTPHQIQAFLDARMSGCDTHGTGSVTYSYGGSTVTTSRALYSYRRGNGAVTAIKPANIPDAEHPWYTQNTYFRCLNDYWENPHTDQNNYANRPIPAGARSAAQLIWDAAQAQNISPKVLLVTLQKEQSLLTDTWPFLNQYRFALGAYCPDGPNGAQCNEAYAGFGKQMHEGAALFRYYLNNMHQPWWSHKKPYQVNHILWNVIYSGCGGSNVYIENAATAALYTYTPYQPNQAALNNLYGTGDACSAYGNRNFWRMYNDWFGSPYGSLYEARFHSQSPYPTVQAGQSATVFIQYQNIGIWDWTDDQSSWPGNAPIHLAATNPINRKSIFGYGWPNSGRPNLTFSRVYEANGTTLAANQHVVKPGQIARFEFNLTAPWALQPGTYREHFQPVLEGTAGWNIGGVAWFDIHVPPSHRADFHSQSSFPTMRQNSVSNAYMQLVNNSNVDWYDDVSKPSGVAPVRLAATNPINRFSRFGRSWPDGGGRTSYTFSRVYEANGTTLAANQHVVKPGQIARFEFNLTAPNNLSPNNYREFFQLIREGAAGWSIANSLAWLDVTLLPVSHTAAFHNQSAFPTITRGQSQPVHFQVKNTSNVDWYDSDSRIGGISPIHLAATNPINRKSIFGYGWPNSGRPNLTFSRVYEANGTTLAANQHVVKPGQIARFEFNLTAPWALQPGTYREHFQLVAEGPGNWSVANALLWFDITVVH